MPVGRRPRDDGAQPYVELKVTTVGDDVPVGASKIGGAPDLPKDFEWPSWNDRPLDFLAQINLAEVAGIEIDAGLPESLACCCSSRTR